MVTYPVAFTRSERIFRAVAWWIVSIGIVGFWSLVGWLVVRGIESVNLIDVIVSGL